MLSIAETRHKILSYVEKLPLLPAEEISLVEAGGRILRETLHAPHDFPPFSYSAMDGYALRFKDLLAATKESPVSLKVVGEVAASGWSTEELQPGEAMRIFTGAAIPPGADAVVMQEEVTREGEWASFSAPTEEGNSIRVQGEDLQQGEPLLQSGTTLRAGEIGLLASIGRGTVKVSRKPVVAILACGDELVPLHETPKPGQIRESNRFAMATQVRECGGIPWLLPLVPDDPEQIKEQLQAGLTADILVTSGGVSVGDHDWIRPSLEELGVELQLWRVAVKPGKPVVFGTRGSSLVLGLPGNPASSVVTFELFVRPVLRSLLGLPQRYRQTLQLPLLGETRGTKGRTHFVRGVLKKEGQALGFLPLASQSSGNLLSLRGVDAYGILPPGKRRFEVGEVVEVMLLDQALTSAEGSFEEVSSSAAPSRGECC